MANHPIPFLALDLEPLPRRRRPLHSKGPHFYCLAGTTLIINFLLWVYALQSTGFRFLVTSGVLLLTIPLLISIVAAFGTRIKRRESQWENASYYQLVYLMITANVMVFGAEVVGAKVGMEVIYPRVVREETVGGGVQMPVGEAPI